MNKVHYLILILLFQNVKANVCKQDESKNNAQAVRIRANAQFFKACENGDEKTVSASIAAGINVNQTRRSWTALHCATYHGHREVVEQLIAAGADVDALNDVDQTPLYWAVNRGDVALVKILLEAGADSNISFYDPDARKSTLLALALCEGSAEMARVLIEDGASLWAGRIKHTDGTCSIPYNALYLAISSNQIETVRMLFGLGADVNDLDDRGITHLHTAAAYGNVEIVRILLTQGAHVNCLTKSSSEDWRYEDGSSPLHWAARDHTVEVIKVLLKAGAHVDVLNDRGETPISLAIQKQPPSTFFRKNRENDENGATLNVPETNSDSAFEDNLERVIELLITVGANINTLNQYNMTLLHDAGCSRAVQILLRKGLNFNARDRFGRTPLHTAVALGRTSVVKALVEAGANVKAAQDEDCLTPLHKIGLVLSEPEETIQRLIEAGANPNTQSIDGSTPLHYIIQDCGVYPGDECRKAIQILLELGANINAQNHQGQTPLDIYLIESVKKMDRDYGTDDNFIKYLKGKGALRGLDELDYIGKDSIREEIGSDTNTSED